MRLHPCALCGRKTWSKFCGHSCVREAALKLTKRERHRRRFRAEPVICEVVAP